jgi:ATP-dependent Clp protease adaptor protein ClpS
MSEQEKPDGTTQEEALEQVSLMPMYRVILHNDDVTPMDFVVTVLMRFFVSEKTMAEAIMMAAHGDGMAMVAIMPLEHAEFKVAKAHDFARPRKYPLTFSIEPCE